MKRVFVLAAAVLVLAGCRTGSQAQPSAPPTSAPGILAPVDKARDTVGQLNDQQRQEEQQTGGDGGY